MKKFRLSILFCLALLQLVRAQVPVAAFTASSTSGCAPLGVIFTDQSTGDPKFWSWDFGNGEFSNQQNPSIVYGTPGNYTVTLVVRNGNGTNSITKTNYITINPSPVADFVADMTTGCIPSTIQFTDRSNPVVGAIIKWEWDFGDGATSNLQNPQKTYNATGFYTVTLSITSNTGCQAVRSIGRYIRIVPGVTADFSFVPPATCRPPYQVNFTNLTSGPGTLTYQWDFGNSTGSTQTNPSATYAAAGTYNVTLVARSEFGCTGNITKQVPITGITTDYNGPDTVCLNTPVDFRNASSATPVSSNWNFGNGSTSNQPDGNSIYPTPGNYTVKLINTYNGCKDSVSKPLVVSPLPAVDFTGTNLIACQAPLTANFRDLSPDAVAWQWDFGDGGTSTVQNPSHQYTTEGAFAVKLTITTRKGCVNSITKLNFVRIIKPTVAIANAPNGGCTGFSFTAIPNVNAIDGVASWFWDFGNGVTSNLQNPPPVTYSTPGNYTLTLRITTNGNCTETLVMPNGIRIGTPPTVDFDMSSTDACATYLVQFTDQSTPPAPFVDQWTWDFGDGQNAIIQNPEHRYADTGTYTVKLTAYNNRCQGIPVSKTIHIKPPVADFTYDVSCTSLGEVVFTNKSITNPVYGAESWSWEFTGGTPATFTGQNPPAVRYPGVGNYTVRLTVTNGSCTHTIEKVVEVLSEKAGFIASPSAACKDQQILLTATGSNPANIRQYEWSVNGGPFTPDRQSITIIFPNPGVYGIGLRITDINGCQSTVTDNTAITVTGPTANFTASARGGCRNATIDFNDLSTPAATIRKWTFDFGDGPAQAFTSPPFSHQYRDTGRYVTRLTVEDDKGCQHSFESPDTIQITQPVPGFTSNYTTICPRTDIQFTDTSKGYGLTYRWDFGDGSGSTLQNPVHAYPPPDAAYPVKLVVKDLVGCQDSVTLSSYIKVKAPKPAFNIADTTTICPPIETKFTFGGSDYESFYWDFGDGSTSSLTNPTHFYNNYGQFVAKLYLVGYGGCLDSISDTINVYNPYTNTSILYNANPTCDTLTVDFSITTPPSTTFTFYFGDGAQDNTQTKKLRHFYNTPNYYAPSLVLNDQQGCQVGIGGPSTIRVIGVPVLFGMDRNKFCDQGDVYFTDYTIQRQDPIRTRTWTFGDGNSSTDRDPIHRFTQPGTFEVRLTMTTEAGCTSYLADTVRVYRTPTPQIISKDFVCINDILDLQSALSVPDTAITWKWDLAGGGSSTSNPQTSATWAQAGNYTLQLEATNLLGCKNNTSKNILVPPTPAIDMGKDPVIVVGSGVTMPVTYGPDVIKYTWSPPTNLGCTDCPTPFANPKFNTKYNVKVEDKYGCINNKDITITVICNEKNYFIPNTFSPNGDGHNDRFYPRGSSITRISNMQIFNRWGELVFEKHNFSANDASAGWDGTYKGKPANQDVYVYIIEFICENASIVPFKGNVMLVR